MKRKRKDNLDWNAPTLHEKADAILCGDIHLTDNQPIARKDEFVEVTQWKKLKFISDLQKVHGCPIWHSGDLFDFWKPSPWLLAKAIELIPDQFYTIYGNHDLPQHNIQLAHKCGLNVLQKAGKLNILNQAHWGFNPDFDFEGIEVNDKKVLIWHVMTYQGKKPWPTCTDPKAARLLRKYPEYDLILTGHNHKPFVEEYEGRLLVNPGSPFRTHADQIDHKPRVYLWYADTNTAEPVYLPIDPDVISREHIEAKEERDNRINAFIETLENDWDTNLSFEDNLEAFFQANKVKTPVKEIIYKSLDDEKN